MNPDKVAHELRSLKFGVILAGALVAFAISITAPGRDRGEVIAIVSAVVALVAVARLWQLHSQRPAPTKTDA